MPRILIENVTKKFAETIALNDFSINSESNEFLVVVGPSGCGKSTLLRTIAGLESVSNGTIILDDMNITNLDAKDRDISMVFQNYALYPHLSVYDNIAFPLKLRRYHKKDIKEKVLKIAEALDITHLLDRKPKTLSGGQRQRVAIGRAMIRNPKVFLFDEPLSNLDAALREKTRNEIVALHKSSNAVFIYVTHDQNEALAVGERIIVMNDGKIQQFDTPYNIYYAPANFFVASFIGTPRINVITFEAYLKLSTKRHIEESNSVIICVRPENIKISKNEHGVGRISSIEMLGKEIVFNVIFNTENIVVCSRFEDNYNSYKIGDYVDLVCPCNNFLFFDKETEQRVFVNSD